jgi:hypothetical protein
MSFKLGKRKAEQAEMKERAESSTRTRDDFYSIIQIAPIPETFTLSQVLLEITPYVKDAIGIMRVADYKAKRLGETVFVYFPFKQSAQYLETIKLEINNASISPVHVLMKTGRATFIDKDFTSSFHGVPITVMLKGLARKQEAPIYYLMELARYLEKKGVITGMRLGYDGKRDWTMPHGYATFLRQADARQVGGEGGFVEHTVQQKQIKATISENIPMLVAMEDVHLFENGILPWNNDAEAINQLIITYEFPGYLNCNNRVDNKKLLKELYDKYHEKYPVLGDEKSKTVDTKNRRIIVGQIEEATTSTAVKPLTTQSAKEPEEAEVTASPRAGEEQEKQHEETDEEVLQIDLDAEMAD